MPEETSLVKMAKEVIEQARDEWLENNKESFSTSVNRMMDDARDDLIMSVLGFEKDSFGRGKAWRIDHCNGRAGQSHIGVEITERCKTAVSNALNKALENWEPPQCMIEAILLEYNQSLSFKTRDYARHAGAAKAQEIVNELTANL